MEFFSKCGRILQETADLATFTEKIFSGKLHFLYSGTHFYKNICFIAEKAADINKVLADWALICALFESK